MESSIEIRPYRPGDERGINELFNKVFNKSRTIEEWRHKFGANPFAKDLSNWITVAETGDRIVGHYASIPMEVKYKGILIVAGQPVDTMIDPLARKNIGLLLGLVRKHLENNMGIACFNFGFPNEEAYQMGKMFLGYKELGEMVHLFKRLSLRIAVRRRLPFCPSWIVGLFHRLSRFFYGPLLSTMKSSGCLIEEVDMFDERADRLWEEFKDISPVMVVRRMAYLNWRYRGRGYTIFVARDEVSIKGYIVLKVENGEGTKVGYIVDLFSKDDVSVPLLVNALHFFVKQDVDYVLCGIIVGDPMEGYLRRVGFKRHKGFDPLHIVCGPLSPDIDVAFLMESKNWRLTYGDTDGF